MIADFKSIAGVAQGEDRRGGFAKDDAFIRAMIHFEIDFALFGVEEARRNLIAKDPQAQFALAQFAEAVKLTELSASRSTAQRATDSPVGHLALHFGVAL